MSDDDTGGRRRNKFQSERPLAYRYAQDARSLMYNQPPPPLGLPPPVGVRGHLPPPPVPPGLKHQHGWADEPPRDRSPTRRTMYSYSPPPPMKRPKMEAGQESVPLSKRPLPAGMPSLPRVQKGSGPQEKGDSDATFHPTRMSFKAFLETQDDSITDEEALLKYGEYKLEFRRQQLNEFFVSHKEEEWFRLRYHPLLSAQAKRERAERVAQRLAVFNKMKDEGLFESVSLEEGQEEKLARLLDIFVIRLEGGEQADIDVFLTSTEENTTDNQPYKSPRTSSIFFKALPPSVTRAEMAAICGRYSGFLRVAIAEPVIAAADRRMGRRAWATFERTAKVREICFSLSDSRLRGWELAPVLNKDLSKRIRTVAGSNGVSLRDRRVVRGDLKLAVKLVAGLDGRRGLWQPHQAEAGQDGTAAAPPPVGNPLLRSVQDYLVEEVSAEEDELLGTSLSEEAQDSGAIVEDMGLCRALDQLLLYLRLVHSIDYYNRIEYQAEDDMPNRCGLLHVRGRQPPSVLNEASNEAVAAFLAALDKKLTTILSAGQLQLEEREALKLGLKTEADELEKFLMANCQELAQDKWLCPLSGKKFKGPEFVKKHIHNRFADRVDAVRQEAQFFNNYLRDPCRPELPEITGSGAAVRQPAGCKGVAKALKTVTEEDLGGSAAGAALPAKRGSIRERLGVPARVPGIRITHSTADPRQVVDYSDVDFGVGPEIF